MARSTMMRAGGAARGTMLGLGLLVGCTGREVVATPSAFSVEDDAVRIEEGVAQPLHFPTAPAELGPPLPGPPIAARITTAPALTSPSFAPLAGRVVRAQVKLGDRVAPGDRLVLVQTTELPALKHAQASARMQVKTRAAIVERMRRLVESRVGSEHDLIVARSELAESELDVKTATARINSLAVAQEGDTAYWLLATRAGTVVQLDASQGAQVGPDRAEPLATIADLRELIIVGDVAQRDAALLRPGMTAEIRSPGDTHHSTRGVLESVSDVVDPSRQTVPIRVRADNTGLLRPNAYVELVFVPPEAARVRVPAAAVVSDGVDAVVFVEESPGLLRRRRVELGRRGKTIVEVRAGLEAGERVVVRGALLLLNAVDEEE